MPEAQQIEPINTFHLKNALQTHKKNTRLVRLVEIINRPTVFPLYGRSYNEYREAFGNLLPEAKSLPAHALLIDLMGPGDLYRSLQQSGYDVYGVALSLTDIRNIRTRLFDFAHKNSFVAGDILDKQTWRKLSKQMGGVDVPI